MRHQLIHQGMIGQATIGALQDCLLSARPR